MDSSHPFGAFPKVEMRHEQTGRTAMRRSNWHPPISGDDPPPTANEILDRDVCRVPSIAMSHDVGCGRIGEADCLQQIVERDALPCGIELRPFGNAVNVRLERRLRERLELRPVPFPEQ